MSVTCDKSVVFSGYYVSTTNKTDRHDVAEILLKVALIIIQPTNQPTKYCVLSGETANTNIILFDLTRTGIDYTI
jgi:hypothetical protein